MAKPKSSAGAKAAVKPRNARPRPLFGILAFLFAVYITLSLATYDSSLNPVWETPTAGDPLTGMFGLQIGYQGFSYLGHAVWLVPFFLFWISAMFFFAQAHRLRLVRYVTMLALLFLAAINLTVVEVHYFGDGGEVLHADNNLPNGLGGAVGDYVYNNYLRDTLGVLGTAVIFGGLLLFSFGYLFYDNIGLTFRKASGGLLTWNKARSERAAERREERRKARAAKQELARTQKATREKVAKAEKPEAEKDVEPLPSGNNKKDRKKEKKEKKDKKTQPQEPVPAPPPKRTVLGLRVREKKDEDEKPPEPKGPLMAEPEPPAGEEDPFKEFDKSGGEKETPGRKSAARQTPSGAEKAGTESGLKVIRSEETRKADGPRPDHMGDYRLPPMKLLRESEPIHESASSEMHEETMENLVRTLGEFGVKVTPGDVHAGPVITRYDVYPAAGVRVEKIQNLDKNLALGLKALSVRILAPVPGKGCVGIEVPNKHAQSVCIRDILESADWVENDAEIPIALGKEVSGKPLITDLTKMPHLLIAGSTGSGKTVCINAVITSLLYKLGPEDVRFVMVDPKIVEMQVFNSLPHMMIPVVTDPKKVPGALKYLLNEMERRYQLFAQIGVRNIAGFNAKRSKDKSAMEKARELDMALSPEERAAAAEASNISVPRDPDVEMPTKLPYIVCIVDELADLMMVAPADIETGIARLAQLARAAGIHLILATQRPSVNVITGVIKANLPSRIAFKVASKVDSRTILDGQGADHLIGRGDMLFLPPGSADLLRSQGAFVADDEISEIVEWVRDENGEPVFDDEFQRQVEEGVDDSDGGEDDLGDDEDSELIKQSLDIIKNTKRASTSNLQRKLRIGYNRAARVMDKLEELGYVGPENGSSPREILMDLD